MPPLRQGCHKHKQPFCKTSIDQSALSFIGPALQNTLAQEIKRTTSLNKFKLKT